MKRIVLQSDTKMYGVTVMEGWKKILGAIMKWKAMDKKQCVKKDDCYKNEVERKIIMCIKKSGCKEHKSK